MSFSSRHRLNVQAVNVISRQLISHCAALYNDVCNVSSCTALCGFTVFNIGQVDLVFCLHDHIVLFCRIRFDYSECLVGPTNTQVLEHAVGELAKRYEMEWRIYYDNKVKRVAILVSKLDHCLYDLLIRLKAGELSCQIPVIISNHPDLAPIAQQFGVAFRWVGLCRVWWPSFVRLCLTT